MSADGARRVLDCGDRAMLVELKSLPEALDFYAALIAERRDGVIDIVPAARTVLLRFDPEILPRASARTWLQRIDSAATRAGTGDDDGNEVEPFTIEVVYDGADLDDVAATLQLSRDDVIARHSQREWRVAFGGFAPGFCYLVPADGGSSGLEIARHASPRATVAAGAVGLAGEFSGVYPRQSPGGWQIIGTSPTQLWNAEATLASPLLPGRRVRFQAITGTVPAPAVAPRDGASSLPPSGTQTTLPATTDSAEAHTAFTVLEAGPLTLVQDRGRPGHGAIGVGTAGALDRAASTLANRLLGNPRDAATLEVTIGGLTVRCEHAAWIAVTGADGEVTVDGKAIELDAAIAVAAGATLHLPLARAGLRYYLAVRGGFEADSVLGSRSRDTLSGLGRRPLTAGDSLEIGTEPHGPIPTVPMNPAWPPTLDAVTVRLHPGPRADWVEPASLLGLYEQLWRVSPQSNRVGARLEGTALQRQRDEELPSEGMVAGALQLPPSGLPTVLLADHPVTGGYPVIAVVADADLDRFAQLRPGQAVQFRHARAI